MRLAEFRSILIKRDGPTFTLVLNENPSAWSFLHRFGHTVPIYPWHFTPQQISASSLLPQCQGTESLEVRLGKFIIIKRTPRQMARKASLWSCSGARATCSAVRTARAMPNTGVTPQQHWLAEGCGGCRSGWLVLWWVDQHSSIGERPSITGSSRHRVLRDRMINMSLHSQSTHDTDTMPWVMSFGQGHPAEWHPKLLI